METPKTLFLIDAYALIYRSYYAFIKNPRINSKGENTSAIFGFFNTLEEVLRHENPTHLAVAFDPHGKTFRHEAYEQYKAQREETPEVIRWSVPLIKEILNAYEIPVLEVEGFEADDVIGTMASLAEKEGFTVYMMTPDKDYGQLVTEKSLIYKPIYGVGGFEVLGPQQVCEKYGLNHTAQVVDLLSLMGDASDNIPGCPGIGKVYAQKLLAQFDNVENLMEHTDQLKGAIKEKIENNKEQIKFSKFLATIRRDVPIKFKEEELRRVVCDRNKVLPLFERLEFHSWASKLKMQIEAKGEMKSTASNFPSTNKKENFNNESGKKNLTKRKEEKENLQLDLFSSLASETEKNTDRCSDEEIHGNLKEVNEGDINYKIVDSQAIKCELSAEINARKKCWFYAEIIKNEKNQSELEKIYLLVGEKKFLIPLKENSGTEKEKIETLKEIFSNDKIEKVGHDVKKMILALEKYGIEWKGEIFDVMVAHYLLQSEQNHSLPLLAKIYAGYEGKEENYPECLKEIESILRKQITEENLDFLLYEVEFPLISVLAEMEMTGVEIDLKSLENYSVELTAKMNAAEKEIYDLAGETFNINSSKQVGEILFNKLQIGSDGKDKKLKKTKVSKQFSTSEEVLQSLKDKYPIVDKILYYRGIKKLLGTYVDAFPNWINQETGKIHTSFNQTVTSTGRLSSSNPNLQNIPVRDEMGKEMRKVFKAGEGNVFISADYSQIELRIMAELSGDQEMKEAFQHDEDVHKATAAKIYKVRMEEVTADMRRKAKTANFGIIYGISTFGLAERMEVSRTEAKSLIEEYFTTYHRIKEFMDESIKRAQENGYVETFWHRKRYLPDIVSHNAIVRGYAERNAINAPVQGTAADIIKIAMVKIFRALKEQHLKTKMILQVHDELNFIVPEEEKEQVMALIRKNMEDFSEFSIPLKADIGTGQNWLEAH